MSIFDRFRQNRQQSVLPDEVQQYYQTEKRQRRGMAFLLAVAALLVTVVIAAILFFGGKAVYNQVRGNKDDRKPNTSNIQGQSQNEQGKDSAIDDSKPTDNNNNQSQSQSQQNGQQGSSAAPAPSPTPAPTSTPALGDNDTSLPHTGDPGM